MIPTKTINPKKFFEEAIKNSIISVERTSLLHKISAQIANQFINKKQVHLNFICTHNSRRSQLAQVWAFFAADYFHLNIASFSGGTAITAFHRNTIKTLQNVGFNFQLSNFSHQNPKYTITFGNVKKTILGFSKLFDDAHNTKPYIAITTCNNADENCPFIVDALHRFHLPFVDPKKHDNTEFTSEKYMETNAQIASEIAVIFKEVSVLSTEI